MGRTKGALGIKNKNTELSIDDLFDTKIVPKGVLTDTKIVPKSVLKPQEVEDNNEDDDIDDVVGNKYSAEVILSKDFKVIVTKNNKELLEKYIIEKINEDGTKTPTESWRSHGYPSTWKSICKNVREIIGKNKMYEKGIISGMDELLNILRESDKKIDKMFVGLED